MIFYEKSIFIIMEIQFFFSSFYGINKKFNFAKKSPLHSSFFLFFLVLFFLPQKKRNLVLFSSFFCFCLHPPKRKLKMLISYELFCRAFRWSYIKCTYEMREYYIRRCMFVVPCEEIVKKYFCRTF